MPYHFVIVKSHVEAKPQGQVGSYSRKACAVSGFDRIVDIRPRGISRTSREPQSGWIPQEDNVRRSARISGGSRWFTLVDASRVGTQIVPSVGVFLPRSSPCSKAYEDERGTKGRRCVSHGNGGGEIDRRHKKKS